jgi:hypothetical protein
MKTSNNSNNDRLKGLGSFGQQLYVSGKGHWAGWMGHKASGLNTKQLYAILAVFTGFAGIYCLFLIYQGIAGKSIQGIEAGRIKTVLTAAPVNVPKSGGISDDYIKIKVFREYLVSLNATDEGRKVKDSIIKSRPGLLDSIAAVELYINRN